MRQISYGIELSKDPEFEKVVRSLIDQVDEVIETGTYHGDGSTMIFAGTGKPVKTIECNGFRVNIARDNLEKFPNVEVIHAHSLPVEEMAEFIKKDDIYERDVDIEVDGLGHSKELYMDEIGYVTEKDNVLWELINNDKKQIIFLDSAGGVGWMEFKYVMALSPEFLKNKILMLDDIQHVKHYRSVLWLENQGYTFNRSASKRWGYTKLDKSNI
jgi:hypothetical protein